MKTPQGKITLYISRQHPAKKPVKSRLPPVFRLKKFNYTLLMRRSIRVDSAPNPSMPMVAGSGTTVMVPMPEKRSVLNAVFSSEAVYVPSANELAPNVTLLNDTLLARTTRLV
jgi:hypothetical protein